MNPAGYLVGAVRMPGIFWSFSRLGFAHRSKRFNPRDLSAPLYGKHLAVTGANGGIGFSIAKAWAQRHGNVWMLCRNRQRGQTARDRLVGLGDGEVHLEVVDVADFASIDHFVARCRLPHLDALVHNAGALGHELSTTAAGLESTFACHVVGPQRLNLGLMPALKRSRDARVVYVASGGMYAEKLDVDFLQLPPEPFDGVRAYAMAKRAQVVLTQRWAPAAKSVRFFAMHPGWVDTPGIENALPGFYRATKRWLRTTEQGADSAIWLSSAPKIEIASGSFVLDRKSVPRHLIPGTRAEPSEHDKLWDLVTRLASAPAPAAHPVAEPQQNLQA